MVRNLTRVIGAMALLAWSTMATAEWKYSETKDAMTDQRYARTFAEGEGGAIGVKCDRPGPNSLYLHFISHKYLGGRGGGFGYRDALYRFDQDPPVTRGWAYDGRDAILSKKDDVWAFIDRLRTAQSLAIRATTYEGEQVTVVIDVAGSAPTIEKVIEACGAVRP